MKGYDIEKVIQVVKIYNNDKKVINEVAKSFLNKGYNKALAKRVFANSSRIHELSKIEQMCFIESLHYATANSSIRLEKLFSEEELQEYYNKRESNYNEYLPKNYENLSERELAKLDFLNEKYGNRNTKQHYYYLYLAHIKEEEDYHDRDLCEFTLYEIIDTMQGVIGSISTRNNTLSFITKYLDYCVDKGIIMDNVLNYIDNTDPNQSLVDKNKEVVENNYITFDELSQELAWLEKDEENNIHPLDVMIVLLMRSGITNKEIAHLKNSDFDFEKKMVTIRGENGIKKIKLHDDVFHWVEVSKNSSGIIPKTRFVLKTLDDHIVKLNADSYNVEQATKSIKRRLAKFKEVGFRTLNENILITCKKIDILDDIVKSKGVLTTEDFQKVQTQFGNSKASYFKLKTDYELTRGSENIQIGKRGRK